MVGGATYKRVNEQGNLEIELKESKESSVAKVLECDNVVICAGQESEFSLETPLLASGLKVFKIGGALHAGDLDAN